MSFPFSTEEKVTSENFNTGFCPISTILPFGGSSAPSGWLLCDGAAVSRSTYSRLFTAIGETYGVGDGSTTFNLPDMRGRAVIGYNVSNKIVVEDCEDAWNELVDGDVTSTLDAADFKEGSGSAKLVVAAGAGAGDILATEVVSLDLTGKTFIGLWIKSSVALSDGDLQLLVDDTANCASPIESLDIPALAADDWTKVYLPLTKQGNMASLISVGLKMVVDKGAFTVRLDDLFSGEASALGAKGGVEEHAIITNELASHNHGLNNVDNPGGSDGGWSNRLTQASLTATGVATEAAGGNIPHPTMPPYVTVNYIINF